MTAPTPPGRESQHLEFNWRRGHCCRACSAPTSLHVVPACHALAVC